MELIFTDAEVRRFYRNQRRRQLDVIAQLRQRFSLPAARREDDAILLFTTDRVFDAIAQGDVEAVGLDRNVVVEAMVNKLLALIA
jgi:hypothetical protein